LNEKANRLANSVREMGIGREDIVAVMLERSAMVYVCRQGILKSGAAFLCIAPDYPDDRVSFILEDSGAKLIITDKDILNARKDLFASQKCRAVSAHELIRAGSPENPDVSIYPEDLCYCIYTSGSTGRPKGVMIEHGNLANYVSANPKNHETLGFTERARVSLSLAAMTFDVSVMEEFIPLTNGMTAVIASEEEIHDLAALSKLMIRCKADMVITTPSFVSAMLDTEEMRPALLNVMVYDLGADAFTPGLCDAIHSINPNAYIMNGYGPTETTISCTVKVMENDNDITIGRPNANVYVYIIDEAGNELPQGEIGELLICGKGVGRGYINLPEKTGDVFTEFRGMRGYRSGDLARINSRGEIEFHGRKDNQVKVRGFRVELGEIEEVLCSHPDVRLSVCTAVDNKYLVAYYTASKQLDPDELKRYAAQKLTDYMVPNILIQLESMPATDNKKIDRKALPKPDLSSLQSGYTAPGNETEERLCRIFAKVLKLEKVGIDDDFFEIGGTSLAASRVVVMCMNEKIPVVYGDIFKMHTVRELAAAKAVTAEEKNDYADYDYSAINEILSTSDMQYIDSVYSTGLGDILLTGATGFLGMHILREYLENYSGKVYCLIRKGKYTSPEQRLRSIYHYYFGDTAERFIGERLFCIEGDITDKDKVEALDKVPFQTLINCAACVKHFASNDILSRINVEGVENLVSLCSRTD
ncbi:MAG: amino acid adenylation domain-containing protein, partial [Oscillospiraceae bacterium]|nr:amino acid adenylation domain-containing protein [Oscillospiraceae bacterium]